jgi:hypothetical protein
MPVGKNARESIRYALIKYRSLVGMGIANTPATPVRVRP